MIVVMMGLPGSGKSRTASRLENRGFKIITLGNLLRDEIANSEEKAKKLLPIIERAELVDDELICKLIEENFDKEADTVFDGFPKNKNQAEWLKKFLKKQGKKISVVLHFDFTEEEMYERLKGRQICKKCQMVYHEKNFPSIDGIHCDNCSEMLIHKIDDEPDRLKKKLEIYRTETKPVIEEYKDLGLAKVIDATQSAVDMYYEVMESNKRFLMRIH